MESFEPWMSVAFVVLGVGAFFYGLYSIVILVKQYLIEAEEAKHADKSDVASLASLANGKYVLLTGKITESNVSDELSKLVIFRQENWVVHKDPEYNTWHGTWKKEREVFPAFYLQLADGEVVINANTLTRLGHEKQVVDTYKPTVGRRVSDNIEGTVRHVGFKAGDEVSVLGKKGINKNVHGAHNEENITPLAIVGGSRKRLLEYFDDLINKTQNIGYAATICGFILSALGLYLLR